MQIPVILIARHSFRPQAGELLLAARQKGRTVHDIAKRLLCGEDILRLLDEVSKEPVDLVTLWPWQASKKRREAFAERKLQLAAIAIGVIDL